MGSDGTAAITVNTTQQTPCQYIKEVMQAPGDPAQTRARRACEPCRRKKTKCPGERPMCSFCRRLRQPCTYSRRREATSDVVRIQNQQLMVGAPEHDLAYLLLRSPTEILQEGNSSRERLQQLESHVEQIYGLLSGFRNASSPPARVATSSNTAQTVAPLEFPASDETHDLDSGSGSSPLVYWPSGLNEEIIGYACQIYVEKLHCQPLPLFDAAELHSKTRTWPEHLLLSFTALTARFVPELLPHRFREYRLECYQQARRELMIKLASNDCSLELMQSLCLLILDEIAEGNNVAAWLDIGIAARMAISTNKSSKNPNSCDWDRLCWSIYSLDRIYGASFSMAYAIPTVSGLPDYPQSHPIPQVGATVAAVQSENENSPAQQENGPELGIDACCIRLLSVWGHAMDFLRDVKDGKGLAIWSENGPYQKILAQLYTFEKNIGQAHRIQNTRPAEHSPAELESYRGYWAPWMTMQFLYHAVQVLINHPFLHLTKRRQDCGFQPPSFLQHTVDQMILHSSWVISFIKLCDEKNFRINDPFVAHLVSITATGYLFSSNASDADLAQRSHDGFDLCYGFVKQSSIVWTHLKNTLDKLDVLRQSKNHRPSANDVASAPSVQTSLLWSLFDYSSSTAPTMPHDLPSARVELNVTTQFLSPINAVHSPHAEHAQPSAPDQTASSAIDAALVGQVELDLGVFDTNMGLFDPNLMAEFQASILGGDLRLGLGQL